MLYFCVGDGSLAYGTPVDNTGTFVDVSLLIELAEYLQHCIGTALIHGKPFPVPVCRRTQLVELVNDPGTIFFSPVPAFLQESLPAQICLFNAFFFQFVDYLNLCGNCRMVRTRLPESLIALHSLIADQDILHGIIQGMAHMQLSRNIWRRHHNGKWLFAPVYLRMKIFLLQPFLIKAVFYGRRIIGFFQFFHGMYSPFFISLKASNRILAVILRLDDPADNDIVSALIINHHMDTVAFLVSLDGFPQRGLNAD